MESFCSFSTRFLFSSALEIRIGTIRGIRGKHVQSIHIDRMNRHAHANSSVQNYHSLYVTYIHGEDTLALLCGLLGFLPFLLLCTLSESADVLILVFPSTFHESVIYVLITCHYYV